MKYKVIRSNSIYEYTYVEANSIKEAIEGAIDLNVWEEVPNSTLVKYDYTTIKVNNENN